MNFNKMKTEKSTYDNLTHSIPQLFDKTFNSHRIDDGYDNVSIATNTPSKSSGTSIHHFKTNSFSPSFFLAEQFIQAKRSQSIHLKFPFSFQMTTNQVNHQRTNTSKYTFTHQQTPAPSSSTILRHISTPSLELSHHPQQVEPMNLTRSSFGRQNIRKKQPRTNPNYVNIQIKTSDGTLRSTYIRLNEAKKCQTFTFSSSSSSSPSSSEANSILCNSTAMNVDFSSEETLSNHQPTDLMIKQFLPSSDGKSKKKTDILDRRKRHFSV